MALETGTYISDLNPSNPVGATDKVSTLDDHVRLIKATLQNTFPNIDGEVSATEDELNYLDGVTGTTGTGRLVLDDAPTIADLTVSGTEFEVNADALDFNGPVDISGTLVVGGTITGNGDADISGTLVVGGTITGDGSGLTSLNAGNLSSGTVPDARLSSNVPLKDAPNEWTNLNVIRRAAGAALLNFETTDAGGNEKLWGLRAILSGTVLQFGTRTDTGSFGTAAFAITRNGATVAEVELNAGLLEFNGAVLAGTIATSTSTTLAAGQVHAVTGNATLPNMSAGQWVGVINNSGSPITVTKHASDTMYWTASGASVTSVTVAARGKATFFAANNTNVYASGNITGAS